MRGWQFGVEYGVVVGQESLAQDPRRIQVCDDGANTDITVGDKWTKDQALCHGEVLATDSQRHRG
jgi:hypothetical protein